MKSLLSILFALLCVTVSAQTLSIADVQGSVAASPYDNQAVTIKGAVTGVYSTGYFMCDDMQEWSGIYIYDPSRDPMPRLGDTVHLTGLVDEYYDWTEIKNITAYEVVSSGNPPPEPVVLTADLIGENWESCLIRIEEATCTDDDLGFGEWEVNDGTGSLMVNDLGVSYTPEQGEIYTLTGNLAYSFGDYKIEPRFPEDIQIASPVYFTASPEAYLIEQDQIGISWSTNTESTTEIEWGFTSDLEEGPVKLEGTRTDHSVVIGQLDPATIIYVRPYSVLGSDTTSTSTGAYITASSSSGKIRVAFNRTYTDMLFSGSEKLFTHALADTIIQYIGMAEQTLDIAFYDFTDHASSAEGYASGIAEAIYQAASRGVKVRLITDAEVADAAPGGGDTGVPRLAIGHDGIMHHKFMIVDHNSAEHAWVLTGSTNPNYNNMVIDFNNLVAIQDQSLARAYLLEFIEIWGGDGTEPDPAVSRSGSVKQDHSPHRFNINGTPVELFFSPSDRTTARISEMIRESANSVDFAIMAFTENVLGDAVTYADNNGMEVSGIIDYVEFTGSEFDYLTDQGLDVLDYRNPDGSGWPDGPTLHHKFAVIDAGQATAAVITGSHNWTAAAESRNDENTLIIHDQGVADKFMQEYQRIRSWLENPPVRPELGDDHFQLWDEDPLVMQVLDNDVIEGLYTLEVIQQPEWGSLEVTGDYVFEYAPGNQFGAEPDSIMYLVTLDSYPAFSDTALVTIAATPSGMLETASVKGFSLWPNPASRSFFVGLPHKAIAGAEIWITDLMGRTVSREVIFEESRANIRINATPGIYVVRIYTGTKLYTGRIVLIK